MPAAPTTSAATAVPRRRQRRRRRRESSASRFGPRVLTGLAGLICLVFALLLASQHPLGGITAVAAVLLLTLLARFFWTLWPGWMLALVPLLGFAPWTGWMLVEELDLLVLASAAGGYFAISGPHRTQPPPPVPVWRRELRWRRITLLVIGLFALSTFMAMVHGIVDAGGIGIDLYQGYQQAGESMRAGKAVFWMLLMLPLWQRVARRTPQTLTPALVVGTAGALWAVCAGVLYERIAYTELSNFSTDYRVTGLFWEMHVGGAALDGALALLLPFALLALLRQRGKASFTLAAALLMLGLYAVLGTFSRGLYLALALALPLTVLLWVQQDRRLQRGDRDPASSWLPGQVLPDPVRASLPPWRAAALLALMLAGVAVAAWLLYPRTGYRGLLALAGTVVALLAQPRAAGANSTTRALTTVLGLVLALPLLGFSLLMSQVIDDAVYFCFALYWLASLLLARAAAKRRRPWFSSLGDAVRAGFWFALAGSVVLVAWTWAGTGAAKAALPPVLLLALAWPLCQGGWYGELLQGLSWRTRLAAMAAMVLAAAAVAALGGAQVAGRLGQNETEQNQRLTHWSRTLSALDGEGGWIFGAGAGRFVSVFQLNAPADEQLGDYRHVGGSTPYLLLSAGSHPQHQGELLRITQRLDAAPAGLVLQLKARNVEDVNLLVEICQKHLLHSGACISSKVQLRSNPDGWRSHRIELGGQGELRGGLQFAIALAHKRDQAMLTELSLRGADGRELLKNGSFRDGLKHWFPTSEEHQLPWHAKSLGLQLLFEQGVVGLLLGGAMLLLALGRLLIGEARDHPLAPALSTALIAFLVLGLFDSLIDAPRIAFLFLTLLALGLGLRAPPPPPVPVPASRPLSSSPAP
jgi:hypothetical protein